MNTKVMQTYIQLILLPALYERFGFPPTNKNGKIAYIILDNYKSHSTEEVTNLFREVHVEPIYLPENFTPICQPLDVRINGEVKARIRNYYRLRQLNYLFENVNGTYVQTLQHAQTSIRVS